MGPAWHPASLARQRASVEARRPAQWPSSARRSKSAPRSRPSRTPLRRSCNSQVSLRSSTRSPQ
eukprot:979078-Pyramimonas_sp.AAC.1